MFRLLQGNQSILSPLYLKARWLLLFRQLRSTLLSLALNHRLLTAVSFLACIGKPFPHQWWQMAPENHSHAYGISPTNLRKSFAHLSLIGFTQMRRINYFLPYLPILPPPQLSYSHYSIRYHALFRLFSLWLWFFAMLHLKYLRGTMFKFSCPLLNCWHSRSSLRKLTSISDFS